MVGLLFLGVLVGYVAFWLYLIKHARNRLEKIAAIGLGLLIPFWDVPFGLPIFAFNCSTEAGNYVEAGFRLNSLSILVDKTAGFTPRELTRLGFKVIEYESSGQIVRYTVNATGLTRSLHATPVSPIRVELAKQELPLNITRYDYLVKDVRGAKLLGRQTDFYWRTPWWTAQDDSPVKNQFDCRGGRTEPLLLMLSRTN